MGSIWGGVLDHPGAAGQFSGGPSCPAQMPPPSKNKFVILIPFAIRRPDFSFLGWRAKWGGQLGTPKNCLAAPWGFKTPSAWSPTWWIQIEGFELQLGTHLGGLGSARAAKNNFLEAQLRGEKMNAKHNVEIKVLALVGLFSPAASPGPRGQS